MLCGAFQRETLREDGSYCSQQLVFCPTTGEDHRTSGQSEPNDEEYGKHRTRSNGDSLQKTEKEEMYTH